MTPFSHRGVGEEGGGWADRSSEKKKDLFSVRLAKNALVTSADTPGAAGSQSEAPSGGNKRRG